MWEERAKGIKKRVCEREREKENKVGGGRQVLFFEWEERERERKKN